MAISLKFYHDAALTSQITAGAPLTATQETTGALPAVDKTIYLGSTVAAVKFQDNVSPGVAAIVVSVIDAVVGSGAPATEFKLALTSGGLATATAGAALTLGVTINSGAANAIPIFTRRVSAITVAGSYTDVRLDTQTLLESP